MSDPHDTRDPLEAELAALRPADLPPDLVARVGRDLAGRQARMRRRWIVAGVALAASVLVAAALWPLMNATDLAHLPGITIAATTQASNDEDDEGPALFAYRRALAGPPDALDERLDRDAARTLPAGPRVTASTPIGMLP
jgi:hypothetical protein